MMTKIKKFLNFKERMAENAMKQKRQEAERLIKVTCAVDDKGEIHNYISVDGMRLFEVSNENGYFSVDPKDVGEVLEAIRVAYVESR